jgi:hypothetical protein
MSYNLVSPEDFTQEHKKFVESVQDPSFREKFSVFMPEHWFCAKDINSRYIIAGDYAARLCGLSRGEDCIDIFDQDLPCKVAEFAQDFVDEDRAVLGYQDENRTSSMVVIHEYASGLESFFSRKRALKHGPSKSILGVVSIAYKVDLSYFFNLLPNYFRNFGANCNIESADSTLEIDGISLTEYEHEVVFLMIAGWSYKHIAYFMNKYRPPAKPSAIYKCRDRICAKFDCEASELMEILIGRGFHRKMPSSFFHRFIGLGNTPISS